MRLAEIENNDPVYAMLMKLRKGAAASLNAKKLEGVFEVLGNGWKIEKATMYKPSEGGWALNKMIPGAKEFHQSWRKNIDGRVELQTDMPRDRKGDIFDDEQSKRWRANDEAKLKGLKDIEQKLAKFTAEKGPYFVRNIQSGIKADEKYSQLERYVVSFEFFVRCNVQVITSPDGQTYEVFGDHKNGALNPTTFQKWFEWAVENTDIMDRILEILDMEPHEVKHDPTKAYTPPKAAPKVFKEIFEYLTKLTAGVRDEQKKNLVTMMTRTLTRFDEAVHNGDKRRMEILGSDPVVGWCYDKREKTMRDGWESQIDKLAEDAVEDMQNAFTYKNSHKLGSILDAKGELGKIGLVHIDTPGGVIEATLDFTFTDGSSFRVRQTSVMSYSVYGKPFYRFPTTFHDVVLPSGKSMAYPSEENMNEIFVKEKA